jgi:DnaK suppressor protein
MNATVTKSAKKKTASAKSPGKAIAKSTTAAKTKGAGKTGASALKRVATKLDKKPANIPKPAAKSAKATVKIGVKAPSPNGAKPATKTTAKTSVQNSGKSVAARKAVSSAKETETVKQSARAATKVAAKSLAKKTEMKSAKKQPANGAPEVSKSNAGMSSNKASAPPTVKIEKPVVPKVSEVATKQIKPNPPIITDGALLSEAQVLKMSEKDYMNEAQLAFFKARLQQLEKDLLKNAGETTEHLRETVLVPDPADRATIEEEHALELRTRDRERKLLKKVQQSLASIESGEYGWCEETGEPIGIPRLLARPTATLSLEAQQRRELKQKLYGD